MRALFVGRFQPFHKGHLKVIEDILEENERVMIVIGGPEKTDGKNPFSFKERKEMLKRALREAGIRKYEIREIADVNSDDEWNKKVKKLGKFDVAYSRNPWTVRCLKKAGIPVKKHQFYKRYIHCGTRIRNRILSGKEWKNLVPGEVYDYIKEIKGEERIRKSA